jgi:hypothetical protein
MGVTFCVEALTEQANQPKRVSRTKHHSLRRRQGDSEEKQHMMLGAAARAAN